MLLGLVRWLVEALVRLYYPARTVDGREKVPAARPLVFVLNHPNGLLDPMVLRVALGQPARFLAKSTLYGNPIGRVAMDAFGCIPIYRAHEAGGRAGDVSRNEASFALCRAALAAGGALALFPEGVSHSDPQLRPLKTGAARIALTAEAEHDGGLGVTLVPVGLYYERKARFRSAVLLVVGEPILVGPHLADYRRDEAAAVTALTRQIDDRLDEVVLQSETRELLTGIARVARWTEAPAAGDATDELALRHARARELLAAYVRLRARDPALVDRIAARARAFARSLRLLGVRDPWAFELGPPRPSTILLAIAAHLLAAPLAAVGALMGWIPYRLAGWAAVRLTADEDILGTVKLVAGATFLFVTWLAEAVAVACVAGARWGAPVFLAGIGCGYAALRFEELLRQAVAAARVLALRAFHRDVARRLGERRRALAEDVARALAEAG